VANHFVERVAEFLSHSFPLQITMQWAIAAHRPTRHGGPAEFGCGSATSFEKGFQ
jgi:hypothetical protein